MTRNDMRRAAGATLILSALALSALACAQSADRDLYEKRERVRETQAHTAGQALRESSAHRAGSEDDVEFIHLSWPFVLPIPCIAWESISLGSAPR